MIYSLKFKFIISFSSLFFIAVCTISYLVCFEESKYQNQQFLYKMEQLVNLTCNVSKKYLELDEFDNIKYLISDTVKIQNPEILYIFFVSGYADFFALRDDVDVLKILFFNRKREVYSREVQFYKTTAGANVYEYALPLFKSEHYMGTLIIGFSQDEQNLIIQNKLLEFAKKISFISLATFFVIVLFSVLVANFILKPINNLTKIVRQIAVTKEYMKINVIGKDEAGRLAIDFNNMIDKIKELDVLKDNFVSMVSHELKTPLTAISGYSDLLLNSMSGKDFSKEKHKKGLDVIKNASNRLSLFIDNLLDLAKIKSGKIDAKFEFVPIKEISNHMKEFFIPLSKVQEKKFICNTDADVEKTEINIDKDKITRVLINLIGNAFKFTGKGDVIKLTVSFLNTNKGKFVEFAVSDTGIGIEKKYFDKIFGKFYQVEDNSYQKKGAGLGLAIVHEIVKMHKGNIFVESEKGKGSTFKLALPVMLS